MNTPSSNVFADYKEKRQFRQEGINNGGLGMRNFSDGEF
jgi:hypothetical protein